MNKVENFVRLNDGERMQENLDLFDFELTTEEMRDIKVLDTGRSLSILIGSNISKAPLHPLLLYHFTEFILSDDFWSRFSC